MSDKQSFVPEKLSIIDFKLIKGQIETPEAFLIEKIKGHHLENSLQLAFNMEEKLIKADFIVDITTESEGANSEEAKGSFHLMYIFKVENLEDLVIPPDKDSQFNFNTDLGNALSSISYSTSRGVLIARLQGTALQDYILPVINPNRLLHK